MMQTSDELSLILNKIVDELSITQTMQEKAISGYNAVGKWLGDDLKREIHIYPQGSMALGTIIRPISDKDEYDIDLVCLISDGYQLEAKLIKQLVGNSIKNNRRYKPMLDKEGKRCWTLNYDEFHMDILPSVPVNRLTNKIRLTHTEDYKLYSDKYSNPLEYRKWFLEQMRKGQLLERFEIKAQAEIDDVPTYNQTGNLQKIIQLLKRHRDIMFEVADNKPISIIITTLAAKSYSGNLCLYDELKNILQRMGKLIEESDGQFIIRNPVEPNENFADKWCIDKNKAKEFFRWLQQAKYDFIDRVNLISGLHDIFDLWSKVLGDAPVKRAIKAYATEYKNARDVGRLNVNMDIGLTIGATVPASSKVKKHTFYGVED